MALSGSISGTTSNSGIVSRIDWSATQSIVDNTSTITASGVLSRVDSYRTYGSGTFVLTVNGTAVRQSTYADISYNSNTVVVTATVTVPHNLDGTKSCAIAFTGSIPGTTLTSITCSQTVTLDAIPRASTIGATDANIGAVSMVAVNRKSSAYTHSIAYRFGTLSGYLTASGGVSATEAKVSAVSVPFTVPATFYAQIPSAKSGTCTLTCRTYSGTAQIGSAQSCTFTATAPESACAPAVSGTVKDENPATVALTGDANTLIRYHSTALCTLTATAKNSAAIRTKSVNGQSVSSSLSLANVQTGTFTFSATDSRGYTGSQTLQKTLVPYVLLTCNAAASRDGPTTGRVNLTLSGNYFDGSFGKSANTLTVTYRYKSQNGSYGSSVSLTPEIGENTWSAKATLEGLTYTGAWVIEVTAKDALSTVTKEARVSQGIPVFDWGETDFNINGQLKLQEQAVADFIVEQGQSDIWTYRKWNSGVAECWAHFRAELGAPNVAYYSWYRTAGVTYDYPFAFKATPCVTASADSGTDHAIIMLGDGYAGASTPNIYMLLPISSNTIHSKNLSLLAVGLWK